MSTINWFPGHMHKARKEIAKVMDEIDVVIEVLDARLPVSSENPMVSQLRKGTPVIKLLNKSDLADPQRTQEWADYYNSLPDTQALIIDYQQKKLISTIPDMCSKLVPARSNNNRQVRAMIMGIPNVGKSTMINALLGKRIAKVGNEPAVTKGQTRFTLKNGMALSDTPGMLWPKIEDIDSGYRLAASGAIKNTAIEYEDIALYAAEFLRKDYPELLMSRYKLKALPERGDLVLEAIGRKRGGLRPGGVIDIHKASEILLNELRGGQVGQITYETVAEWLEKWEQQKLEAERLELERIEQERLDAESQSDRSAHRHKKVIEMSRIKKKRTSPKPIFLDIPRRSEKLADPDSYESRKRRNLEQKKKHKSVYEKAREAEQAEESSQSQRNTPLADKIRRLKRAEEARKANVQSNSEAE